MADGLSDKDIFDSTELSDEEVKEVTGDKPESQPRDENGRFASKEEKESEPETPQPQEKAEKPDPQQSQEEPKSEPSNVPPGLIEERRRRQQEAEARAQAEQRARELEMQLAQMQGFLRGQQRPQEQPKPEQPPDMFVDPEGYMAYQRKQIESQLVAPLNQQMQATNEYWSRRNAERDFGSETVTSAYNWLQQSVGSGDPEAQAVLQRSLQDRDPYGLIVKHYQQRQAIQQVGTDPNKWFEKTLEEKLSDPVFQQAIAQKLGPLGRQAPLVSIPSINKASGSSVKVHDDAPGSEEDIYQAAPRRMGRRD